MDFTYGSMAFSAAGFCALYLISSLRVSRLTKEKKILEEQKQQFREQHEEIVSRRDDALASQNEYSRALEELKVALDSKIEEMTDAATRGESVLNAEKRKSKELFDVVEKVLAERDQWRDLWHAHGRAHAEAQSMLESALVEARTIAKSSVLTINKYRKLAGHEPIAFGLEPGEKPVGSAAKFKALLERAEREAPDSVDGIYLRDAIVASAESRA